MSAPHNDVDRVSTAIAEAKDAAEKALPRSRRVSDEESAHQRLARRNGRSNTAFGLVLDGLADAEAAERAEKVLQSFPGVTATVVYQPMRAWITAPDDTNPNVFIEALATIGIDAYLTRSTLRRRATRLSSSPRRRPSMHTAAEKLTLERLKRREAAASDYTNSEVLFTARQLVTKVRFWVSLVLSIPVVVLSLNVNWQFPAWQWLCAVLTTVVATYGGWPFHRAMLASLRRRMSALDGASSIAILASWAWTMGQLLLTPAGDLDFTSSPTWFAFDYTDTASESVYFDVSCGVTVLLLAGRLFTRYNRVRSGAIMRTLRIPSDRKVIVVRKSSKTAEPRKLEVPVSDLHLGEDILVPPGSIIPVDGLVVGGKSTIDARAVGYESGEIKVKVNSKVWAGSINLEKQLKIRVWRTGSKTRAASISRWLQRAIKEEAAVHQTAVRSASALVPWALSLAVCAFGGWWLASGSASGAFAVSLAMLAGVTPVALAISTSTVQRIGILASANNGILIRDNDAFRALASADVVMFNRVGTLTKGEMHVSNVTAVEGENPELVLRVTGALMMESDHPASMAIVRACRMSRDAGSGGGDVPHWIETSHVEVTDDGNFVGQVQIPVRNSEGQYETRFIEARVWRPRDLSVLDEHMAVAALSGGAPMVVSWRGKVRGVINVGEDVKDDAIEGIDALEEMGVDTMMISRDPYPVARYFADRVGISRVFAGIIGSRKPNAVRAVHASGETIVMVGDSDIAPCLRAADVGILMDDAEGSENIDVDYSGVVALRSNVMAVPEAIEISRAVVRTMDANIYISWTYNVAVLFLSILGVLHPLLATLLMIISSLYIEWRSRRISSRRSHLFHLRFGKW